MRTRILAFVLLFISIQSFGQEKVMFEVGDSFREYFSRNEVKYTFPGDTVNIWPESNYLFYSYFQGVKDSLPIFLSMNGEITGALQGVDPNAHYIYDMDGDGKFDFVSNELLLPYWIIYKYANKDSINNIKPFLDELYYTFQSNQGPVPENEHMKNFINGFYQFAPNTEIPNRDIFYLLYIYTVGYSLELNLDAIEKFKYLYTERFNENHITIMLYLGESLLQLGEREKALEYFKYINENAPDFIPAKYYLADLETDAIKREKMFTELKQKYSNHWMFKE